VELIQKIVGMYSKELCLKNTISQEIPFINERGYLLYYSSCWLNEPYLDHLALNEIDEIFKLETGKEMTGKNVL